MTSPPVDRKEFLANQKSLPFQKDRPNGKTEKLRQKMIQTNQKVPLKRLANQKTSDTFLSIYVLYPWALNIQQPKPLAVPRAERTLLHHALAVYWCPSYPIQNPKIKETRQPVHPTTRPMTDHGKHPTPSDSVSTDTYRNACRYEQRRERYLM